MAHIRTISLQSVLRHHMVREYKASLRRDSPRKTYYYNEEDAEEALSHRTVSNQDRDMIRDFLHNDGILWDTGLW